MFQTNSQPTKTEPNVREYITASDMSDYEKKVQSPEDKKFMESILNDPKLKADFKKAQSQASAVFMTDDSFVNAPEEQKIKSNSGKVVKKAQQTR